MNETEKGRWGGARRGAGRKTKEHEETADYQDFQAARLRHLQAKTGIDQLALNDLRNELVSAEAVELAAGMIFTLIDSSLASLPARVERAMNLPPEVMDLLRSELVSIRALEDSLRKLWGDELTEG